MLLGVEERGWKEGRGGREGGLRHIVVRNGCSCTQCMPRNKTSQHSADEPMQNKAGHDETKRK